MLTNGRDILNVANKNKFAVGAFNVNNLEFLQAIIESCEENQSPVIIQTSEGAIKYAGIEYISNMVKTASKIANVPICLHLDHGTTYETIIKCIRHGYSSVMIDASHFKLEKNIEMTKEIVKIAHSCNVSVEAELGRLSGIEDQISVSEKEAIYTNPEEAEIFVKETGIDFLAIAIGTAHGQYKGKPLLDFERLDKIKKLLGIPIVLHGASGICEEDIEKAINLGVNKINIDTDIRIAFTDTVRDFLNNEENKNVIDPRKIFIPARKAVKKVVEEKIRIFKSKDKAKLY